LDHLSDVKASPFRSPAVRLLEENEDKTIQSQSHWSASRSKQSIEVIIAGSVRLYSGPAIAGVPNGVGSIRFLNVYLGQVMDGKVHGKGTMYTKAGLSRGRFEMMFSWDNGFIA